MPSRLLVPRDLMPGAPATVEAYLQFANDAAAAKGRRLIEDERAVIPFVNGGMWVFRCHHCDTHSMLDPEWPLACCFGAGCHRVYATIVWPDTQERGALEAELEKRPQPLQHWGVERGLSRDVSVMVETVEELRLEREEQRDIRPVPTLREIQERRRR